MSSPIAPSEIDIKRWKERLALAQANCMRPRAEVGTFFDDVRDFAHQESMIGLQKYCAEALLLGAKHFYLQGNVVHGALFADDALEFSRAVGDSELLQRACSSSGVMHADLGQISTALTAHIESIQLGDEARDPLGLARCYVNLGACLFYASQLAASAVCYQRAFSLAAKVAPVAAIVCLSAQVNLAAIELRREAFDDGLIHIEIAKSYERLLIEDPAARYNSLLLNVNAARISGALGRISEAGHYLSRAKLFSELINTVRATCVYTTAEGALLAATGKRDEALVVLQKLVANAQDVPNLRIDALTELARTLVSCGRRVEAQTVLQELAETSLKVHAAKIRDQLRFLHLSGASQRIEEPAQIYGGGELANLESSDTMLPITRAKLHQNAGALSKVTANSYNGPEYELLVRTALFAEIHDDTTGTHCYRVGRSASLLAARLGMLPSLVRAIDFSGRLHDIGKITIPDKVLRKPGVLAPIERQVMEQHTVLGAKLLHNSKVDELDVAEEIALCHHENWDGSGYPNQLEGEAIPISARIVALADVYDALTHHRIYKPAFTHEQAVNMMLAMRGYKFQPELYDEFMRMMATLQLEHGNGLDEFLSIESQDNEYVKARQDMFNLLDAGHGALNVVKQG
jgi:putative two-component system response regulator